jgi:hypothetical protein
MRTAIQNGVNSFLAYAESIGLLEKGTMFQNNVDIISLPHSDELINDLNDTMREELRKIGTSLGRLNGSSTSILPIVPDAAIQYRCSDNLHFGK